MFCVRCLRDLGCAAMVFGLSCANALAKLSMPDMNVTRSISGQFIVTGSRILPPLAATPAIATNADFVRLKPALLAVSAERIKRVLWRELAIDSSAPWRGKIYLVLHSARSVNEDVTIVSEHFANGWDYRVALPDVLSRTRFLRALTGVILLEYANRGAGARSADIPAWLIDGLSQQLLATGSVEIILSSPVKAVNGFLESRTEVTRHGVDPLARARRALRDHPPLTFEQLCWPTPAQVFGADGGVYRASAQLFVSKLLKMKNGPVDMRAMLQLLPKYYNWQTAFQKAFPTNFARPLDVEKWWALRVVDFMAHSPGPLWTPAVSREKLDQILSVPVNFRAASNALPVHASVSLQVLIRNFNSTEQRAILQAKLRSLELAQFRMARLLAALTAEYRNAIADYLGEGHKAASGLRLGRHSSAASPKTSAADTIKKLDALDARRRRIESAIKPDVWRP